MVVTTVNHRPQTMCRAMAMTRSVLTVLCLALIFCSASMLVTRSAVAAPYRILAVMSYNDSYPWQEDLKNGITNECGKECEVTFFSLDMKNNPQDGAKKGEAAFRLFQELRPDGVIAADDYAQSAFVVPFLRNRVATPVVFCGVNEEPEVYGYPAANVTGVLERFHSRETIDLLKQLVPSVKSIGFMVRGSDPSTLGMLKEFDALGRELPGIRIEYKTPETLEEALQVARELGRRHGAVYVEHFEGIPDQHGRRHPHREVVRRLLQEIGKKPTICATDYTLRQGVLASVVKSGAEQGILAVKQLREVLNGVPPAKAPIIRNRAGVKYVNVKTMKALGLEVKPSVLRDVKLVTTD